MCGIIGIVTGKPVAGGLIASLKLLEYRGYDSAGIATMQNGTVWRERAAGKLANLEHKIKDHGVKDGGIGIGHTRWATHGAPTEANAHPHIIDNVIIVHNGIIENYAELRDELLANGADIKSDTDTEIIGHLISNQLKVESNIETAIQTAIGRLTGAFALAIMIKGQDDLLIGARKGCPLVVGIGDVEGHYIGSDALALSPFSRQIVYLDEGDFVFATKDSFKIFDQNGQSVERDVNIVELQAATMDKGKHKHFMAKEFFEQPDVVQHTLAHYIDLKSNTIKLDDKLDINKFERIVMVSCGTAFYAAMVAKYWLENTVKISVEIDVASEYRYRNPPLNSKCLFIVVSQSGETADTLAALRLAKQQGAVTVAIVNVPTSTMAREADIILPTFAGTEVCVASTKAFMCQISVLATLSIGLATSLGRIDPAKATAMTKELTQLPRLINDCFSIEADIIKLAHDISKVEHVLFLGRHTSFPIAMEGALKLKEITYIHAEGYAAGELKHGPIALIDEKMPLIIIAPDNEVYEKTRSNIEEIAARGGDITVFTSKSRAAEIRKLGLKAIALPDCSSFLSPFVYTIPVQLLAYHTAVHMGTDVDQPRNLAKSVTVE
ncbi:MAG: glutamine--fructose-6-phosphate transaminase (isomerizing) [Rhizobiales bacterium]|nr:glutamine--fructose-6-phosphate transaminase (isomerizing) [Hyphomicrobiales bacterium]NRB14805.1 glutamine--fructose-6-phosphate transaminase (isomerizing) [Hyphomicrobiales bacterium]